MWRERGRGARDSGVADHRVRRPGYGELCRHLHRHLRRRMNDHEAYGVRRGGVTSIKLSSRLADALLNCGRGSTSLICKLRRLTW